MSTTSWRIASVSLHTSPVSTPGSADAGGMNVVVLEQGRALAAAGHRVDILTRRTDPDQSAITQIAPGLRLLRLDGGPATPLAKSAMERAIAPFSAHLEQLVHEAEAAGDPYDLLHSHHWFSGAAALPVAQRHGLPHLQSFHSVAAPADAAGFDAGEPSESAGRIAGERAAARGSDAVVAVSLAEARTISARYGVAPERIAVIPPGVDAALFHPSPAPASDRLRAPHLLFAARLQPLKGPDLALETLALLEPDLGARLDLAGSASEDFAPYREELAAHAQSLGVRDRVRTLGALERPELAARMREAAALLLPSWSETFGLVALEAQASGTPVIAWAGAGGVREALGAGSMLLESREPAAWADALAQLLGDAAAYTAASQSARDFAASRSWEASAQQLAHLYADVLAAPARRADPWALLEGAARVLAVHAHPDDETLSTGALLAELSASGTEVALVTATRGEAGEVVPGALADGDPRPLSAVRAAEADLAARALGIDRRFLLGEAPALAPGAGPRRYRDSGMEWVREGLAGPSADAGPESFTRRSEEEAVADLAALIAHVRPDAVIGYDDEGTYGHPDHVRAHRVTAQACALTAVPFVEVASAPEAEGFHWRAHTGTGTLARVREALQGYRTQLTVIDAREASAADPSAIHSVRVRHVGGQEQDVVLRTGLRMHASERRAEG
ncbi:glycosyltransferase [Brachybacterium sp. JHP9]|uniref:D-inositol 3-phosphate glycosyltransferase n=1 Tax=Brachybacterium equifaecis TaxID=2910770 RepID=A0ABT0QZ13_9MICO|nr:glycosyltransferase [Brachybacterium equifaecis]MCL6421945.1 glycosyltransferase [Brachybacterium equifaecis]